MSITLEQLEKEYIESNISQSSLSDKYNFSDKKIQVWSKKNNWVLKRKEYKNEN